MQYRGTETLARITVDGVHHAEYLEGTHLLTAGSSGAWCFRPTQVREDIAPTADTSPRRQVNPEPPLVLADPSGGITTVDMDGVLAAADFDDDSVHLGVEHDPWTRTYRDSPAPAGYVLQRTKSWIYLPLDAAPNRVRLDDHPRSNAAGSWHTSEYADVTYNERHRRKRAVAEGIRWHWGMTDKRSNVLLVRAYRDNSRMPELELRLPGVHVAAGAAHGDQLWLLAHYAGSGKATRALMQLTAGQIEPRILTATDDLDVSSWCRPVAPEPPDHASYIRYCVRKLHGRRFSPLMHDVQAEFVGDWPYGRLHVRFKHDDYKELILVARLRLYDEQGQRLDDVTRYVPTELMEQADTRAYPDRSHAVNGVLYV
ncbi:hypothetical protein E5720_18825 [Rhodococcus sp. PAMC28707]|uniref:hypothetical protein n=1 Tax=unclassified Rhodococcus (in: high G+C Gram-positive bacteria) TaxID=192944 RepID=UPI00109DB8E6|nr:MULTISPECIES: hypothetical protein [unclassified Rhodococcus (in: high G+C Gram-positive bacteria)]QCB51609.1 hypothetical protein E5769_16700 [Rhodococcus sp. PAMC28705]QCB60223.1 hypothetical protein E5720_18825 [Rhodococcus sp. PAMC28707]